MWPRSLQRLLSSITEFSINAAHRGRGFSFVEITPKRALCALAAMLFSLLPVLSTFVRFEFELTSKHVPSHCRPLNSWYNCEEALPTDRNCRKGRARLFRPFPSFPAFFPLLATPQSFRPWMTISLRMLHAINLDMTMAEPERET